MCDAYWVSPAKKVSRAKEAIKKLAESDQNFNKSVIEEWENIKIPPFRRHIKR